MIYELYVGSDLIFLYVLTSFDVNYDVDFFGRDLWNLLSNFQMNLTLRADFKTFECPLKYFFTSNKFSGKDNSDYAARLKLKSFQFSLLDS